MIGLWVAVGGAIGAVARFGVGGWVTTWAFAWFPWGTLAVNVLGSTVLGFVHAVPPARLSPSRRAFFTVGLCGGFTTFSAFDFETLRLLEQGRFATAGLYSLGSVALCIGGIVAGAGLAGLWRAQDGLEETA